MNTSTRAASKPSSPEHQVKALIAGYRPKYRTLIRSVRKKLQERFPSAYELVYRYSNAVVISWSPTPRGSDAVVAISARPDGLRLIFNHGPSLPDPGKILLGSGRQTRFIWIESSGTLALPEVKDLLRAAVGQLQVPLPRVGHGSVILKASSAKRPAGRKRRG